MGVSVGIASSESNVIMDICSISSKKFGSASDIINIYAY